MRKIEAQMNRAISQEIDWQKDNTQVINIEGVSFVYLYSNLIAMVGETWLELFDGGHQTTTTKSRLNAILSEHGTGERVYQKNFQWFVSTKDGEVAFGNGIKLNWMMMKKYIYQHCNSHQIKVIIARSEYKALTQNFGNLAGYKFSHSVPLKWWLNLKSFNFVISVVMWFSILSLHNSLLIIHTIETKSNKKQNNTTTNFNQFLVIPMSLILKCLSRAEELANEINGDLFYVPEEDVQHLISKLTEDNLEEIASELADLAHWFN